MKPFLALLSVFFMAAQIRAAYPGPTGAVGDIVTISGQIGMIDKSAGSISVGPDTYFFTSSSFVVIDGKPGKLADLAHGMNASGSAEIGKAERRNGPQKKIIRMLTATTDPRAQARSAGPPSGIPPQNVPGTNFPGGPGRPTMDILATKLPGTFWMVPNLSVPGGTAPKLWLSLNADHTTTCSGSEQPGTWQVNPSEVIVTYYVGSIPQTAFIKFNADLKRGTDFRFGGRPFVASNPDAYIWTFIETPTPEMLAKVQPHPAPTPTAVPNQAPAVGLVNPEIQHAASEVIKAQHNNLVFVTGKEGAGSGFIASLDGANYLITNAHVAAGINDAGFKTLDGTVVRGGAAGVAVGHDICRMAMPEGGQHFEVMKGVDEEAGIGDDVVVLGNAEGSGVVNTLLGKIVGIGPNLVEIDAQFVPGNSGSPIVHLKTGKVIGVATYTVTRKYDAATKEKLSEPVVRRFGYRIDSVKSWQPINWQSFYAQAAAMESIHTLTLALDNFLRDLYENRSHVNVSRHTNPVIKARIDQWLESKNHKLSLIDRENADANFISFLKVACQSDITNVRGYLTYDYFVRSLSDEQEARTEMSNAFTEIIKNIRD